jgi:hypothetical protein
MFHSCLVRLVIVFASLRFCSPLTCASLLQHLPRLVPMESYYQVVAPNLISDFERIHFFHGVSGNPPELVWRSDHATNPFPVPPKGVRFFNIAHKTANGVFETDLNPVWDTVAPLIIALFKERGIKYSALLPVRFSTPNDQGKQTLGPVGLWISTHPGKNTPKDARDASPPILQILENHGVKGVVTYWYEGSIAQLASLMGPVDSTNPTFNVRCPLTTVLGMPLTPAESQKKDATGSLGFYFHEGPTRTANLVLGSSVSAVIMFSATTPPSTTSMLVRVPAHLSRTFTSVVIAASSSSLTTPGTFSPTNSKISSTWLPKLPIWRRSGRTSRTRTRR